MYHVIMHEVPLENCIEPSSVQNLVRGPGQPRPGRRRDRAGARPSAARTGSATAIDAVLDDYDYVLIDCPPSLGLLTVNGLSAADEVLVPIQCEYYALEGLGQLLRNVDLVQAQPQPDARGHRRSCCVMYDARTKLADQVVQEVREHFGDKVCRNGRASHRAAVGGTVVRATDHHVRLNVARCRRPTASVAKEVSQWLDAAVSVRASAP